MSTPAAANLRDVLTAGPGTSALAASAVTCVVRYLIGVSVIAAFVGGIAQTATAKTPDPARPRVRSGSPPIVAAIRDATQRSATFRRLIDTIDTSDGLVYIEEGHCGHGVRACLLWAQRCNLIRRPPHSWRASVCSLAMTRLNRVTQESTTR